ncbi:elongation of very long chain fatty acids protein 4-like [Sipha flava]|uniref:Elongation of very long chain fatty acids protein n=1 Tax=Sipha flava TaxID=143950 RepID=A0A2S2PZQ5_9HEMI|nr:elongation of very long chain fatty acids protein 4-like [Sipha flava]XP_025416893.1 elongation of very long chain fatty acids protein 4-like [Sipha flava]XP_025416894.1 elongation of very long chain fatty acids protein 4-like [Sipha flava]
MANVTHVDLNNFISKTMHTFSNLINQELKFDEVADSWVFMRTPWPMFIILAAYLLFVLKLGPNMMKNREPYNIKHIMMIYNLAQTAYNIYIISAVFLIPGTYTYLLNIVCIPDETESNRFYKRQFYIQSWHFVISKVFDLLDTVFFVLRKKQSHVSFLHVYHHVNMVVTTWIFLRFIKGQQGALCGIMNATIHAIMYSYYFLAALGPQVQKYLWWKKYVTCLQIVQFIVGIIYGVYLFIYDCDFPRLFSIYMIFDVLLFLYLFVAFYNRTYNQKQKSQ